jgi:uncharacterized membrane protein
MGNVPIVGAGVVDLQARVTNRKLREIAAQAIAERDKCLAHIQTLGTALAALAELTAEARDALRQVDLNTGDDTFFELVDRIDKALEG